MRWFWLLLTLVLTGVSFVAAPFPNELVLQHIPTVVAIVVFALICSRTRPSSLTVASVILFLWLHLIGARWIYSFVPYDDWFAWLTGQTLSDRFGWQRNHYDRLVHFASGVLFVFPASETLQRSLRIQPAGAAVLSICVVLSVGAVYEIIEWQLAVMLSPAQAEAYNGQQGDIWDPQKDLALAWIGALVTAPLAWSWRPSITPESNLAD